MSRDAAAKAKAMNKSMASEEDDMMTKTDATMKTEMTMMEDVTRMKEPTMVTSPRSLEGNRRKRLEQEINKKMEDSLSRPDTLEIDNPTEVGHDKLILLKF